MRIVFISLMTLLFVSCNSYNKVLLDDDFSGYEPGFFGRSVGPELEYHFFEDKFPAGAWTHSAFADRKDDTAFRVVNYLDKKVLFNAWTNKDLPHTHPMLNAGEKYWGNYIAESRITFLNLNDQTGIIFRYQNDRQYYYFGREGKDKLVLYSVDNETAFRVPKEDILAITDFSWEKNRTYKFRIKVEEGNIEAYVDDAPVFRVSDNKYAKGGVAVMADVPAYFHSFRVSTTSGEVKRINSEREAELKEEMDLQALNPEMKVWKKIETAGFGTHRNVRFGDLNGDGQTDILIGQVIQHNPPGCHYCELAYITALTTDGEILWQTGTSNPSGGSHVSNDVAFQIYDINGDGKNEVIYTRNFELIIAEGATGKILKRTKTPEKKDKKMGYDRILGDCIYIFNSRGKAFPQDILIKDRQENFWVYDENLNFMWGDKCVSEAGARLGHFPYSFDTDRDGRDELMMGYTLYSSDGKSLWTWNDRIGEHVDGAAIVNLNPQDPGSEPLVYCAASDEGFIIGDLKGNILKHHFIGHAQNPVALNMRSDMPGIEIATINFWGNQGIINFFNSKGEIYKTFEPVQAGSMMLPINWNGRGEEFFVLNSHHKYGGMYDGWGRKVVAFPDDGHPFTCYAVLDFTGDHRDEVVVWETDRMWIYTQDDNPSEIKDMFRSERNPLYNYSNYQFTVSLPLSVN